MSDLQRFREVLADRYLISRELGRGGMATVYLAQDLRHARQVAVKVVRPELVEYVGRERFLREIHITAGLAHPHIAPLLDSGEAAGTLFYVMPLVDGATLADRVKEEGPLAVHEAVRFAAEVADALDYAHQRNIVHRDVKPSNILLEAGHAVLSDFGVALPTTSPQATRMTRSGVTMGTAEYMSPEQCSGEHDVDARSDVYSLGCVLHEMLAGAPPFTGRTPAAIVTKQIRDAPARLQTLREEVPPGVERVVLKALEKEPGKRFQSAKDFADALKDSVTAPLLPLHVTPGHMRLAGAVLGGAVTVAAVVGWWVSRPPDLDLDEGLYAVASFYQEDPARVEIVDGSRCQTRLREALLRWDGVEVVDPALIRDRELRREGDLATRDAVLADAAAVGAGRLIWGQVWTEGDTTRVEGTLYDVASGASLRSHNLAIGASADVGALFDEMADSLLVGAVATEAAARAAAGGTRSLTALRFYDDGHKYLRSWNLQGAGVAFAAAVDEDPDYVQASLWRSLVGLFEGADHDQWRRYAATAARSAEKLSARERLLARGLLHLAQERWQEACGSFRQAVATDPLYFAAWLGLGDCLARDNTVEASADSPTGWGFHTSYQEAAQAFLRALELAPSYNVALSDEGGDQFRRVLPVRVGDYRPGRGGPGDTVRFGAFPEVRGDSIAYHPVPLQELGVGGLPATTVEAIRRNRTVRGRITEDWINAFPESMAAMVSHAGTLEARGQVAATGSPLTSALDAISEARGDASGFSDEDRLLHAAAHVRLLVKNLDFPAAAALADSVLARTPVPTPSALEAAAGLAILRGRPSMAADLLQATAAEYRFPMLPDQGAAPLQLRESVLRLRAFAAAGGPFDSLTVIRRRVKDEGRRLLPSTEAAVVLSAVMSDELAMVYTVAPAEEDDPPSRAGHPFLRLLRSTSLGDTVSLRTSMEGLAGMSASIVTGAVPLGIAWMDVHLKLALGDTAGAVIQMNRVLSSLRSQDRLLLLPGQAGPLVRTMVLSARLGRSSGDAPTDQWARAAAALWADGEPFARSLIEEMTRTLPPPGSSAPVL